MGNGRTTDSVGTDRPRDERWRHERYAHRSSAATPEIRARPGVSAVPTIRTSTRWQLVTPPPSNEAAARRTPREQATPTPGFGFDEVAGGILRLGRDLRPNLTCFLPSVRTVEAMDYEAKRKSRRRAAIAFVVAGVLLVADVAVVAATRDHRDYDGGRIGLDRELPGPQGDGDLPFDRDNGEFGPRGPSGGRGPVGGKPPARDGRGDHDESRDRSGSDGTDGSATTTSTTVAGGA